jgi:hypothetical protein
MKNLTVQLQSYLELGRLDSAAISTVGSKTLKRQQATISSPSDLVLLDGSIQSNGGQHPIFSSNLSDS